MNRATSRLLQFHGLQEDMYRAEFTEDDRKTVDVTLYLDHQLRIRYQSMETLTEDEAQQWVEALWGQEKKRLGLSRLRK